MQDGHLTGPLGRASIEAADLVAKYPPRLPHRNKRAVYDKACPPGALHRGTLTVSRWAQELLPLSSHWASAPTAVELREGTFTYDPPPRDASRTVMEWHLNFAHTILFVAYGGPLFAQDEMQVAEHPALGSVREWLTGEVLDGLRPVTREDGVATPMLLRGVERRCAVATDEDPEEDRPLGLYGNAFARAREEAVRRATRVLDPPTVTNILAMEAPPGATGRYTPEQIHGVMATAYTGFRAARLESALALGDDVEVVLHTGHWGTGAYGGNRVLMAMLQVLAAKAAGLHRMVFHTYDRAGAAPCREALARLEVFATRACTLGEALTAIDAAAFEWGVSDGN